MRSGEADCLIVTELARLTRSAAELGKMLDRLGRAAMRLVVIDLGIDTGTDSGRLAARALTTVGDWEHERLAERTRKGLAAARARGPAGRPAVTDRPELVEQITRMRARGMTLQAIADALNAQGEPTVRGGARWRPSSVQSALGYKRRPRPSDPAPRRMVESARRAPRPTAEREGGTTRSATRPFQGPRPRRAATPIDPPGRRGRRGTRRRRPRGQRRPIG